jgi:hypothetical protein
VKHERNTTSSTVRNFQIAIAMIRFASTVGFFVWLLVGSSGGPLFAEDSGTAFPSIVLREEIAAGHLPYRHPADVCELRDGTLLTIYNGGEKEAAQGNRIYVCRKEPHANAWTEPIALEPNPENTALDIGVIFQPRRRADAPVLCYYWWKGTRPHDYIPHMRFSEDNGFTWSPRIACPPSSGGPILDQFANGSYLTGPLQCAPIELSDGSLLAAGHYQTDQRPTSPGPKRRAVPILRIPGDNYSGSQAGAPPWKLLGILPDVGLPGFLILSSDIKKLALVGRTAIDGPHTIQLSQDTGLTWSDREDLSAGGIAGVGTLSLDVDGGPAQGWHVVAGSNGLGRNGLVVAIANSNTSDLARNASWKQVLVLHKNEGGEDADPTLIQTKDRQVHLVFTGRKSLNVMHYVLDPDKLCSAY